MVNGACRPRCGIRQTYRKIGACFFGGSCRCTGGGRSFGIEAGASTERLRSVSRRKSQSV